MTILSHSVTLKSGVVMPLIGFGTFQSETNAPPGTCKAAVLEALRIGIRHIDTAWCYGTEAEVGEAIRESGIPREELFVVTKLYQTFHQPEDVAKGLESSLKRLGLDYIDLYLMHFPYAYIPKDDFSVARDSNGQPIIDWELTRDYISTWKAMETLVDNKKARAIGISNFSVLKTKRLLAHARIQPDVNQCELHPYLPQHGLLEYMTSNGIHLTAHSPLGGAPIAVVAPHAGEPGPLDDDTIIKMAERYACQPSQIILSWAVQRGTSIVPKSRNLERILLNSQMVNLSEEDFKTIDTLRDETNAMRMNDPKAYIGFDIYNEEEEEPNQKQEMLKKASYV